MKGRKTIEGLNQALRNENETLQNSLLDSNLKGMKLQLELMKFNSFDGWDLIWLGIKKLFKK